MKHLVEPERTVKRRLPPLPESVEADWCAPARSPEKEAAYKAMLLQRLEDAVVERWSYCGRNLKDHPENEHVTACAVGREVAFEEMCGDCLGALDRRREGLPTLREAREMEKGCQHEFALASHEYRETLLAVSFRCTACDKSWGPFGLERETLPAGSAIAAHRAILDPRTIEIAIDPHHSRRLERGCGAMMEPLLVVPDEWPWKEPA